MRITRRKFLDTSATALTGAAVAATLPRPLLAGTQGELNVFAWYAKAVSKICDNYAAETGVKVNYLGGYPGNPIWWAKMMAGEKWDFFIPSMSWLQKAVRAGLMEPIDLSQIPNIKNLSDRGRQVMETELSHEGRVYGVPWTFVLNPIVWNTEKIPQKPETWATLWDEQYAGRITIKDEPLLAVMVASLYTGQDPYNIQDWGLIKSALMEQRKLVKKYWTSHDELGERLATEEVWLTQSNDGRARKLVRDGVPVSYTVPKEGAPATIDAMAIPKAATNKDAAHAFIDYILRGNVMSEEIEIYDYMTLNPSAYENVDPSYSETHVLPSDWKLVWRRFVPQKTLERMNNLWLEVKVS